MDFTVISKDAVENIIGFSFMDGGFFAGYKTIEIKILNNKILCEYFSKRNRKRYEISIEVWNEFKLKILRTNILAWNKSYSNPDIEDGEEWEIKISLSNGKQIYISGVNAYPKEWNEFKEIIYDYFPKMKLWE
jgi:hypothetical protein